MHGSVLLSDLARNFRACSKPSNRVLSLITLLILTIGFPAIVYARPPGNDRPPSVTVHTVQEQPINPATEYVGRIEAIQVVDLRARVEGFIERVAFREGAEVNAGELLFLIEQAPYQARREEARAKVDAAQAARRSTHQYLQRLQAVKSGGVSAFDLEAAQSNAQQTEARLQEATAALAMAQLNLDYTTIRAPIKGRIGRTAFSRGNLVWPGSGAMARIVQTDPIRVVYAMNEADLLKLRAADNGAAASDWKQRLVSELRLADNQIYPLTGRFDFIDNQMDPSTGTIAVRAVFDNPDGLLVPGQFATVMIRRDEARKMPMIPQSAVMADRDGRYVFVVDDQNRAQLRRITTGATIQTQWAVQSGLSAGEVIVVQGVQKVAPGQAVIPIAGTAPSKE
jgi:RND family efflux transporter MFP subunit